MTPHVSFSLALPTHTFGSIFKLNVKHSSGLIQTLAFVSQFPECNQTPPIHAAVSPKEHNSDKTQRFITINNFTDTQ